MESIDAIINAYYEVFCGSSNDPWQFERDKHLHAEDAVIISIDDNGNVETNSIEQFYIPVLLKPRESFYEKEINRIVLQFGNIAQVWSTCEIRTTSDDYVKFNGRLLNNIQLYFSDGRWWISGWTTQNETDNNPIPSEYLRK